jgi:signal peptidase II
MRFTITVHMKISNTYPARAAMLPNRSQLTAACGLTLFMIVVDFVTEFITQQTIVLRTAAPVTSFFNYVHYRSTGAALGMLADSGGWQRWFFATIAGVVAIALIWWLTKEASAWMRLAFAFMLDGAISNGAERTLFGYVTDFLDFHWAGMHWPAFNVADMAICAAAALLISHELMRLKSGKSSSVKPQ